jgi:hypothetical protein
MCRPESAAGSAAAYLGRLTQNPPSAARLWRVTHCYAARKLRRELNAELAFVAQQTGQTLVWSTAEAALIERAMATVDRIGDLQKDYDAAETAKQRLVISTEIRLCDGQLARLLKAVKVEAPRQESLTTIKARQAVNVRWQRERECNAASE